MNELAYFVEQNKSSSKSQIARFHPCMESRAKMIIITIIIGPECKIRTVWERVSVGEGERRRQRGLKCVCMHGERDRERERTNRAYWSSPNTA
jgi:hypothetical protein